MTDVNSGRWNTGDLGASVGGRVQMWLFWYGPGGSKAESASFTSDTNSSIISVLETWSYSEYSWTFSVKLFPPVKWCFKGDLMTTEVPTLMSLFSWLTECWMRHEDLRLGRNVGQLLSQKTLDFYPSIYSSSKLPTLTPSSSFRQSSSGLTITEMWRVCCLAKCDHKVPEVMSYFKGAAKYSPCLSVRCKLGHNEALTHATTGSSSSCTSAHYSATSHWQSDPSAMHDPLNVREKRRAFSWPCSWQQALSSDD